MVFVASLYGVAAAIAARAVLVWGRGYFGRKPPSFLAIATEVAIPIFLSIYRMERLTRVKTPWRPTLGLFGIEIAGFVLSMVLKASISHP
jgi:hypothetical protein